MPNRLSDFALVMTVLAFLLLTPPVLTIFNREVAVLGVPLLYAYCFGVWLAVIAAGGWAAWHMVRVEQDGAPPPADD
ncbi:MAG: hypothetical protein WBW74_02490 [Xanthobacteraceae bacterium]